MKKKKTKNNGSVAEKHFREKFIEDGYDVDYKPKNRFFMGKIDLFGLWDFIAIKNGKIVFVQVKSTDVDNETNVISFKTKAKEWIEKHGNKNNHLIIYYNTTTKETTFYKWCDNIKYWEKTRKLEYLFKYLN